MDKINFEDLPGTNTPINADNLNDLQDNVDLAKMDKTITVTDSGANPDNYTSDGIYYMYGVSTAPSGSAGWLIVMTTTREASIKQFWIRSAQLNGTNEYLVYMRAKINNTWSAWKKFQMDEDSGWITPTLINGQQPTSSNYTCQYRKINNIVYLRGVVTSVTQTGNLFILDAGYRPKGHQRYITNTGNTASASNVIRVSANGEVALANTSNTGTFEVTLDGICFVVDN